MALEVPALHDAVITLRAPALDDVDVITRECQDPEISRFTRVPSPYTRDDATHFVEDSARKLADGTSLTLVVGDGATLQVLGTIGLMRIEPDRQVAEIGYWVAASARRRGIATRAVRLLAHWAVVDLGIARVELMTRPENVASQSVATRAGFTREGTLRSYTTLGCGLADVVMFSLVPGDVDPDRAAPEASARG